MTAPPETAGPGKTETELAACDAVAARFVKAGLGRVYTVPGDLAYPLLSALVSAGITVYSFRSQASAVFACAADSLSGGRLASAVLVTRGPALANAMAAASSVVANGTPLLVLAPGESAFDSAQGAFQGGIAWAPPPGAGWRVVQVDSCAALPGQLDSALAACTGPAATPVLILIDRVVLGGVVTPGPSPVDEAHKPSPGGNQSAGAREIADILSRARHPVVVVGHRARWSVSQQAIRALARRLDAPICPTGLSIGFAGADLVEMPLDEAHPALARADVVLLLGAALDWTLRFGAAISPEATLVQLPGPTPLPSTARRPDLCVEGGIGAVLDQVLAVLPEPRAADDGARPSAGPGAGRQKAGTTRPDAPLFHRVVEEIGRAFPPRAALVLDGSGGLIHAARQLVPDEPWARITPGMSGHLGASIGHAVGAMATGRFEQVVVLCGDFSLGLALADLETLVRYRLAVKLIVANNFGLASEGRQLSSADRRIVSYSDATDYAQIMRGFGGTGYRIDSLEGWQALAPQFFSDAGPCLVDVMT